MNKLFLFLVGVISYSGLYSMDPAMQPQLTLTKNVALVKAQNVAKQLFPDNLQQQSRHADSYNQAINSQLNGDITYKDLHRVIFDCFCRLQGVNPQSPITGKTISDMINDLLQKSTTDGICGNCQRKAIKVIASGRNLGRSSDLVCRSLAHFLQNQFQKMNEFGEYCNPQSRSRLHTEIEQFLRAEFRYAIPACVYKNLRAMIDCWECAECKNYALESQKESESVLSGNTNNNNNNNKPLPTKDDVLVLAAASGDAVLFKDLLAAGEDPRKAIFQGKSLFAIAQEYKQPTIISALIEWAYEQAEKQCPICFESKASALQAVATGDCLHFICVTCKAHVQQCPTCQKVIS